MLSLAHAADAADTLQGTLPLEDSLHLVIGYVY